MNFYPFHIGDYISHTHHLTDAEDLAYRRMMDLYYQQEKGFLNAEWVARRIKSKPEIVKGILEEFFEFNEEFGFWANTRADIEIAKYHAIQAGGRKGAAIRWHKDSNSPPNAPPLQTKNQDQEPLPRTNNKNTIAKPEGLADLLWKDFLILRKSKKLPVTQTAFNGIAREAKKANKSLPEVIQICCERGWGGFKAEWLVIESLKTQDKPMQKWDSTLEGVMNKGKELGILPKPGETEGQYRERVRSGHK